MIEKDLYLYKRFKLATFRRWTKGSREASSEGLTNPHIRLCSLEQFQVAARRNEANKQNRHTNRTS